MTIQTKAALTALLADNTSGDISPQDLRDFLDSVMGVYGSIVIEDGSTAQAVVAATPEIVTEWTANGVSNGVTPDETTNKITIDNAGVYQIELHISFQGINNATQEFHLHVNGNDVGPHATRKTGNNDAGGTGFSTQQTLAVDDELTIHIDSDTTGSFTIIEIQFSVRRIG